MPERYGQLLDELRRRARFGLGSKKELSCGSRMRDGVYQQVTQIADANEMPAVWAAEMGKGIPLAASASSLRKLPCAPGP